MKKLNNLDDHAATTSIRRENCKMLHWSKTRGRPQHDESTHESPPCANTRTTTAASSRKKKQQSLVPLLYVRV